MKDGEETQGGNDREAGGDRVIDAGGTRRAALERLRARFARVPADVCLSDELIAERRTESRRDDGAPRTSEHES